MAGSEHAEELLQIEEADAWFEYLEATRGAERDALRRGRAVGLGPPLASGCAPFALAALGFAPRGRHRPAARRRDPRGVAGHAAASLSSGHAYVFQHHTQRATGRFRGRVFARAHSRRSICHPGSAGSARKRPSSRRPPAPAPAPQPSPAEQPAATAQAERQPTRHEKRRRRGSRGGRGRKKPGTAAGASSRPPRRRDEKPELKPQPAKRERKAPSAASARSAAPTSRASAAACRRSARRCRRRSASC